MNKHQKIAYQNLKNAFNWIIGGYYNSIQDGMFEDANTPEVRRENLFNEFMTQPLMTIIDVRGPHFMELPYTL